VHWNELADGRVECPIGVNCDDLTELTDWGGEGGGKLTQNSVMRIGGFR